MRMRSLAWFLGVAIVPVDNTGELQRQNSAECSPLKWKEARLVSTVNGSYFHDVTIAQSGGRIAIGATAAPNVIDPARRELVFFISDNPKVQRLNHAGHLAVTPRLGFDSRNWLHLFYGEGPALDEAGKRDALMYGRISEIWHAYLEPGQSWSQPVMTYRARVGLMWALDNAEVVRIGNDVRLVVAEQGAPQVVEIIANGRDVKPIKHAGYASAYTTIATRRAGNGVLGYIMSDPVPPSVGNSVFARQLSVEPSPAVRVQRSEIGSATMLNIRGTHDGNLVFVWGQNHNGGLFADGVRWATSSDGGQTWTSPETFAREHGAVSDLKVVESGQCLRAAYLVDGKAGKAIRVWQFDGSGWTQSESPRSFKPIHSIAIDSDGERLVIGAVSNDKGTKSSGSLWIITSSSR
jgi:hypothetical protein